MLEAKQSSLQQLLHEEAVAQFVQLSSVAASVSFGERLMFSHHATAVEAWRMSSWLRWGIPGEMKGGLYDDRLIGGIGVACPQRHGACRLRISEPFKRPLGEHWFAKATSAREPSVELRCECQVPLPIAIAH